MQPITVTEADREEIDMMLFEIYRQQSTSLTVQGIIARQYYIEKLYEKLFGEGQRPGWMK